MNSLKPFLLIIATSCLLTPLRGASESEPAWKNLLPAADFGGWTQYGGDAKYEVKDGVVIGTTVPNSPNSFMCTKQEYGDFILEYEFQVDPKMNSGVQIRSQVRTPDRKGRVYGYQVEIDPSARAWTAGIYDEARRGWLNPLTNNPSAQKAFKQNDWNKIRVAAIGSSIKTWINDVPAADLIDSMTLTGFIALQVHGTKATEPMTVRWRNIRIRDLGQHVWKPLFNGHNLEGWHTRPGGEWAVKEGVILGISPAAESRHGLLVSDRTFDDFTVRLQFKVTKGNSGFYFRAEEVDSPVGVHGFQAEIEPGLETGGLYETGGRAWVARPNPEEIKKIYKQGEWNQMTVSARDDRVVVHVNHQKTVELQKDPGRKQGKLALQLHGGQEMRVEFKGVEHLVPAGR